MTGPSVKNAVSIEPTRFTVTGTPVARAAAAIPALEARAQPLEPLVRARAARARAAWRGPAATASGLPESVPAW